jgi:ABC-type sugar transport system substrate-binding protein
MIFATGKERETEAEKDTYVIGYVSQIAKVTNETAAAYLKGIYEYAELVGCEIVIGDAEWNAAKQVDVIEDLVAQGADGIVTEAIDSTLIVTGVETCNEAGVPVAGFVNKIAGGEVLIHVMSDARQEGALAAQKIVDELVKKYGEPRGLVLEITGPLGSELVQDRSGGFWDVMNKYPDIEVIQKPCDWELPRAEQTVRDVLTANPDLDGIYEHSDYYGDAVEAALVAMDRLVPAGQEGHIIWTSIDGAPPTLNRIRKGWVDSTSNAACTDFGMGVKLIYDYLTEGKKLKVGDTVEKEGAVWSPGIVIDYPSGPILQLSSFLIDKSTVDNPALWGNGKYEIEK